MINIKPKTITNVALHLLVWILWFSVPILFSFNDPQRHQPPKNFNFYIFIWVPMAFSMVLFYLNYLVLVDKLLFNKKNLVWFFGVNLILIVVFAYTLNWIRSSSMEMIPITEHSRSMNEAMGAMNKPIFKPHGNFVFSLDNLIFIFVISISVAIRTTNRWFLTETERKNLENENLKSKLSNLKMQLNPHFFFNTLNNIYSLIKSSPDKAQESVHGLAKLMRYHLYETNEDKVPLSGEVDFLKNYIELMKIRMTPNVEIETEFKIENQTADIAPLLFVSLVENSFKHGTSPIGKSFIKIAMVETNKILSFEIINTDFHQKTEGPADAGIGLENLRNRLALIYPGKHTFTHVFKNQQFHVNVIIQL
ncbi:MAG: sensor histidine kinase [Salinivirgaceae bacterium]